MTDLLFDAYCVESVTLTVFYTRIPFGAYATLACMAQTGRLRLIYAAVQLDGSAEQGKKVTGARRRDHATNGSLADHLKRLAIPDYAWVCITHEEIESILNAFVIFAFEVSSKYTFPNELPFLVD